MFCQEEGMKRGAYSYLMWNHLTFYPLSSGSLVVLDNLQETLGSGSRPSSHSFSGYTPLKILQEP